MREVMEDVIVAQATAPGQGALAIVRIDGAGAAGVMARIFYPANPRIVPAERPREMILGRWVCPDSGEILDEGLAVFFRGPSSFTGNDCAEWHCHGGPATVRLLIEAARQAGARPAEPGEFTRRAFLNGKLDLAQAEAVAELINAQTVAAARMARAQLDGALSERIRAMRETLIGLTAEIEARIDFPEEDIEPEARDRLAETFAELESGLRLLLETRRRGQLLREGARVALVGAPNAGKSSLFNALARMERAIVTPHPGTTRDTVECTIDLGGAPVTIVDTAGLRESADPVERIGVERSRAEIERAECVVWVRDLTALGGDEDNPLKGVDRIPELTVWNKIDAVDGAPARLVDGEPCISAVRGDGLRELEGLLLEFLTSGNGELDGAMAVNQRHGELLESATRSLKTARRAFLDGASGEFVIVDLREALDAIGAVLGLETGDAVLDRIFNQFCLGK